jgi:hypothetical protein
MVIQAPSLLRHWTSPALCGAGPGDRPVDIGIRAARVVRPARDPGRRHGRRCRTTGTCLNVRIPCLLISVAEAQLSSRHRLVDSLFSLDWHLTNGRPRQAWAISSIGEPTVEIEMLTDEVGRREYYLARIQRSHAALTSAGSSSSKPAASKPHCRGVAWRFSGAAAPTIPP